jgi:hypothetical protein
MASIQSFSIGRLCSAALLALTLGLVLARPALAEVDPMANAKIVGEKICGNCHDTEKSLFGHTQHAKIFRENPRNDTEKPAMAMARCTWPIPRTRPSSLVFPRTGIAPSRNRPGNA